MGIELRLRGDTGEFVLANGCRLPSGPFLIEQIGSGRTFLCVRKKVVFWKYTMETVALLSMRKHQAAIDSCPMVALPNDVARSDEKVRDSFNSVFKAMVAMLGRDVKRLRAHARKQHWQ